MQFDKDGGIEYELLSKCTYLLIIFLDIDKVTPPESEPFYTKTLQFLEAPKQKSSGLKRKRVSGNPRGRPRKNPNLYKVIQENQQQTAL